MMATMQKMMEFFETFKVHLEAHSSTTMAVASTANAALTANVAMATASAAPPQAMNIDEANNTSCSGDLPDDLKQRAKVPLQKFSKAVKSLMAAKRKIEKYEFELAKLGKGETPNGSKPFAVDSSYVEIDDTATDWPEKLEFNFEKGLTYRQVKKKLFFEFQAANKIIDKHVLSRHIKNLEAQCDFDSLVTKLEAIAQDDAVLQKAGLKYPPGLFASNKPLMRNLAMEWYKKLLIKVRQETEEEARKAEDAFE